MMMKWFLRILAVFVLTFCLGLKAMPEGMREMRRAETASRCEGEVLTGSETRVNLAAVYDFIGLNFMLADQTDLPVDFGFENEYKYCSTKQFLMQEVVLKSHRDVMRRALDEFLYTRHIHGFYVYCLNKLLI